ncbi:hypothetical protein RJ640_000884 [Escallonia rubra]|uniref:Uncharacterized protein n=1 Tax=Escallonia rubra TaxID=112253 RepID=A0AA88UE55_9ASTE|nr:hypothetical protein RJ640_000884 [Escallonia rubra]
MATQESAWLIQLLKDLHQPIGYAIPLYCDNQLATRLAENPVFHARTKHVEVHYHFIREKVLQEEIGLQQIKTEDQVADLFTKVLRLVLLLCSTTTAYVVDNSHTLLKDQGTGHPATPLDFGAGPIDPNKAIEPGLIYDIDMQGYVDFLCGLGYTKKQLRSVLRRDTWRCRGNRPDLNYPSFVAEFPKRLRSLKGRDIRGRRYSFLQCRFSCSSGNENHNRAQHSIIH